MQEHIPYIHRCFQLAKNGEYTARPNPMVGSVIAFKGKIIGEGWHHKPGEPHAEVMAINSVADQLLLPHSTLYVNLEPCSHFGRTPPCSLLILEKGIPKVVISNTDPNPLVCGKGVQMLREHGVEVITGVESSLGYEINKHFFTFHTQKRPYVYLKWAESLDRFIAPINQPVNKPFIISSKQSLRLAHRLRAGTQSILIGSETALKDNPSLTTRLVKGPDPLKLVIDRYRKLPESLNIFRTPAPAIRIVDSRFAKEEDIAIQMDKDWNWLGALLDQLYKKGVQSLQVEGGTRVLSAFIAKNLWDEIWLIKSHTRLFDGIPAPPIDGVWSYFESSFYSDSDLVLCFKKK
ncbi:bifunctional diaminohydroxyphosphoribosylaminopyrimidine deaminase/5-amino-6-(5-phosphoribosylamino)uracil reductase RibD [Schleiferia thermophila]|jgi:diaminohydroxyphosphoribosylaminopyrimidine deaminase/5-amino-6-(5-phosphoribosylamino)uracil reductase|uniref:Riboflavin biosynthesis protein RibD n=1 Tax=Schleiferia thermophila TaxID=884107 RepID=A0A369A1E8_9FLAO|nr:bifunctional diaminohydroxyphosphoribosylaminopyrimidine deaminase/5-amino-6-(5-phosphoribosylamino)uracil reductase RibD [Schleiferia thermophila]KFD38406.1 hypothetical protein AT05_09945 [Schleiferia thermophila str. Yellowstone]RCX02248.1 diaminohydroxyphosphoribosylaminopyrimidine deaminase [Schleiferia thermophila]GCD80867.1 riboflavin biosynthesis protein RibD [Schleiferia thermophila]